MLLFSYSTLLHQIWSGFSSRVVSRLCCELDLETKSGIGADYINPNMIKHTVVFFSSLHMFF
jgi:hypothetical protein